MIDSHWPLVPFDQILSPVDRRFEIRDTETYQRVGVRWYGEGTFIRDAKLGLNIARKDQWILRRGDVVYNKLFAWKGAFAVASPDVNGCIVSDKFPTYEHDPERVDLRWIGWYFRTVDIARQAEALSKGAAAISKLTLNPPDFWKLTIPLPPLSQQQRIVARIEELTTKIEEARGLRRQAGEESEKLLDAATAGIFQAPEWESFLVPLGEADLILNRESRDPCRTDPSGDFTYVDISSVGRGPAVLARGQQLPTTQAPSRARRVIHAGDVIFSTVRPNLRAVAKIGAALDNQICSTGFAVFSCGPTIDPDFLLYQLYSPFFIDQCLERITGAHYPAVNDTNLRRVTLVVPPLPDQRRFVTYLDNLQAKVDALKRVQAETAAELDAMLPSILDKAFKGDL